MGSAGKLSLYFLSDHEFLPQLSSVEFNFATNRTTQIYAMALRKDVNIRSRRRVMRLRLRRRTRVRNLLHHLRLRLLINQPKLRSGACSEAKPEAAPSRPQRWSSISMAL